MIEIAGSDVTDGIIVSIISLVILFIFYLYKVQNRLIMKIIVYLYKPQPVELKKDTRVKDWLLLIILLVLVTMLGLKLVTLIVVISDSMKPEFEKGDMVLTQSIFLTPEPGDIITFHVENGLNSVSHRVVSISNKGLITTKGDNNGYKDDFKTKQKDVIAKAVMFDGHPIVIKEFGSLFITDYKKEGVIFKWGDRFTFMQQLSAVIKAWGFIITIICILAYLVTMKTDNRWRNSK